MKKFDFSQRFGFLVHEVGRLYGRAFDQRARKQLGLSSAQCRLIAELAIHQGDKPMSQVELADKLDLTPMGVTSLCDRMQAAGWLTRRPSATDRRANEIELKPTAYTALEAAVELSNGVQAEALAGLNAAERAQLLSLLRKVYGNLSASSAR